MNISEFENDLDKYLDENENKLFDKYPNLNEYFLYYLNKEDKNSKDMTTIGSCYLHGLGTEKNNEKSFYWYNIAAKQGNALAQFKLGVYHEKNKNYKEVLHWYNLSAMQGNHNALLNIGCYYDNIEKDYEKAVEWYTLSANKGNSCAQNNLGCYYKSIEKNYEKAVYWFTLSANKGNSRAQNNLGCYYETIEKNYEKAVEWLSLSANQGNLTAQNNLGRYYETIEKNYEEALKWYTLSKNEEKIKFLKNKITKISKEVHILNEDECSICKDSFINNNKSILTIQCSHSFHYDCLKRWEMKCPFCFIDVN